MVHQDRNAPPASGIVETPETSWGMLLMRAIFGPLVIVALLAAIWAMFFRGNPGGISDAKYGQFKQLAPPKLLYSCTRKPTPEALIQQTRDCAQSGRSGCDQIVYESVESQTRKTVEFVGGQGASSYDELLREARLDCAGEIAKVGSGTIEVLEAEKN